MSVNTGAVEERKCVRNRGRAALQRRV